MKPLYDHSTSYENGGGADLSGRIAASTYVNPPNTDEAESVVVMMDDVVNKTNPPFSGRHII